MPHKPLQAIDNRLSAAHGMPCFSGAGGSIFVLIIFFKEDKTMKSILLVGAGQFGMHLARKLYDLGHEIMAVDTKEERVDSVLPYAASAQIGDASSYDFLETLGVSDFDVCFVTIGDDFQDSLETTSLLKELGAKMVVARASNDVHAKFLLRNGADQIVYPEKQTADWAAVKCSTEHVLDYMELGGDFAVYEVEVPYSWIGKTIGDLDVRRKHNINILGKKENGRLDITISPATTFHSGETILVLTTKKDFCKTFKS